MVLDGMSSAPWANQHVALKFSDRERKCLGQGTFVLPSLNQSGFGAAVLGDDYNTAVDNETKDSQDFPLEGPSLARGTSFIIQVGHPFLLVCYLGA